ncbi:MAG: hypothetical protein MK097_11050 [Dechloromonas sp.]|nr:hypothetical protein [Dechloromonas sp.]
MKPSILVFALLAGLSMGAAIPAAGAEPHDHHHEAVPAELHLDQGKKWATDAPLRQGMAAMRAELANRLHAIHKDSLTKDDYAALGKSIDSQVANIVGQCKLKPEADAMLHVIIADLMAAAEAMQAKTQDSPAAGAHKAITALNHYGRYFDHPHWRPLK